jgi:hypothetical protein
MCTKLWFSSFLPGKYFNRTVKYAMVNSFYIVHYYINFRYCMANVVDKDALIKVRKIMYLIYEVLSHSDVPFFLRFSRSVF